MSQATNASGCLVELCFQSTYKSPKKIEKECVRLSDNGFKRFIDHRTENNGSDAVMLSTPIDFSACLHGFSNIVYKGQDSSAFDELAVKLGQEAMPERLCCNTRSVRHVKDTTAKRQDFLLFVHTPTAYTQTGFSRFIASYEASSRTLYQACEPSLHK